MLVELIQNLRAAILWNTACNTVCTLIAFTLLVFYLKDTRWKCVLLCCLMTPHLWGHDPCRGQVMAAEPNYTILDVKPKKQREQPTETMVEISSLLTDKDWAYVQVDQNKIPVDNITKIHEGVHMLDASLSKPGYQGIYLGNGYGLRLKIPQHVKLSDVAIPISERGIVYSTYMTRSREWWEDNCLYTLVEANGYLWGAKTRRELGWTNRSETVKYGIELCSYFAATIDTIERLEPEYDTTALVEVLDLMTAQWRVLAPEFESWPLASNISMHGKVYEE